jgi:hypothetical protein
MIHTNDIPNFTNGDGWTDNVALPSGYSVRVRVEYDKNADAPWDMADGHGPVSGWRAKDSKAPGERILLEDRGSARFYDFADAVKIARRDSWGAQGDKGLTGGAKAAFAAEADFKFLRGWCTDQWHYIVVGVEISRNGAVLDTDYCGAIENLDDYWREHAADHARYVIKQDIKARKAAAITAAKETRERKHWAARGTLTTAA